MGKEVQGRENLPEEETSLDTYETGIMSQTRGYCR